MRRCSEDDARDDDQPRPRVLPSRRKRTARLLLPRCGRFLVRAQTELRASSWGLGTPSLRLKLLRILHQPLHSLDRHGILDLRAHAPDGAVASELPCLAPKASGPGRRFARAYA